MLLSWYDSHARELPWRIPPLKSRDGLRPDPYRIWLSEVMLQQTTVAAVIKYFHAFTTRWPTVEALAAAPDDDVMGQWAGLGYYARARNLLKCARMVVDDFGGEFPGTRDQLLILPGIGPYTAAAIATIAFGRIETVVDGNVERVMARLHDVAAPLPAAKPQLTAFAAKRTPDQRAGDYAQAVMDLGATVCTPKSPKCGECPWSAPCLARAAGRAEDLPFRSPKPMKPTRLGIIYVARNRDGAWLLERRPDKGLLGGMLGWPGAEWGAAAIERPPFAAEWQTVDGEVRHTFTHFHLRLTVQIATADRVNPAQGVFMSHDQFNPNDLPTVMRKAYDLAHPAFMPKSDKD